MQPSRDVAKELPEMPCAPDVVHGSSIVKMSNCFWYNNLYMTLDAHVYEKCNSIGIKIAYLYGLCNGRCLKREHEQRFWKIVEVALGMNLGRRRVWSDCNG